MNNTSCPCMNYQDRQIKCHSTCEKYKTWREAYDEWKKLTDAEKNKYRDLDDYKCRVIEKTKRRMR